jgi:hypothetical protein
VSRDEKDEIFLIDLYIVLNQTCTGTYLGHLSWNMTIKIGSADDDAPSASVTAAVAVAVVAIDVSVHCH